MDPLIRAAIDAKIPPMALILENPKLKYSKWDMRLIKAVYLKDSFQVNGFPAYYEKSPDVTFVVQKEIIRSAKALEAREFQDQERMRNNPNSKPEFGARYWVQAKLRDGVKRWPGPEVLMPKSAESRESSLSDKDRARIAAAEERARLKVQKNLTEGGGPQ